MLKGGYKLRKNKIIILIVFLAVIILMAVGYSTFATDFTINGTTEITGEWDVRITNITATQVPDGCDAGTPTFTNDSINFSAKLNKPGDEIIYEVTIQNLGTIDAELQTIIFTEEIDGIEEINYTTSELKKDLNAGDSTTFNIMVTYVKDTESIPSVKTKTLIGIIQYVQKENS